MLNWLLGTGVGPAAVSLPVNWTADALASAARRWFKRIRRADDLSLLIRAATGNSVELTASEFSALHMLLEDQQTWVLLGRGTVKELADQIAACMPERNGRTAADSDAAALAIARGLLEFTLADLEPRMFQRLLLARLNSMNSAQARALDQALLSVHARFTDVMDQIKAVLDGLPPGPAGFGEIAVYLRVLIDWLETDDWPRDFGGPALTAWAVQRRLRIITEGTSHEEELEADTLVRRCARMVVLGGPGSGKTWLARRTVQRCAQDALDALASGMSLDEVELPLYTTCSRFFGVTTGDVREAVVSSSLDHLGDLGGSRVTAALRAHFARRSAPTLLVIDSLDEAHGPAERLRQAGTLPWRVILTSRPGLVAIPASH